MRTVITIHRTAVVVVAASLTTLVSACASGGVTVQQADGAMIPVNASYAWAARPQAPAVAGRNDVLVDNQIIHDRVQAEIDTVLRQHGWRMASASDAQFLVQFSIGRRMTQSSYQTMQYAQGAVPVLQCGVRACWESWAWRPYGAPYATTHRYVYPEGTLLVDLVERATGRLIWRGIGTEPLEARDLEPSRLQAEVRRVLQSLPGAPA
jgi:hypothetical protein